MTQDTLATQNTLPLTLTELHERLNQRLAQNNEDSISYQILSRLLGTGDIADQLQITGDRNARRVLPDVVDILAAFLPVYRRAQGRLPQAAEMLHAFLRNRSSEVIQNSPTGNELATVLQFDRTGQLPTTDALALAREQGRAQGLAASDEILTPEEAAQFLRTSVRKLYRTVEPHSKLGKNKQDWRYRKSDLLA